MPLIFVIIHHSLMNALTANYFSFFQKKKNKFLFSFFLSRTSSSCHNWTFSKNRLYFSINASYKSTEIWKLQQQQQQQQDHQEIPFETGPSTSIPHEKLMEPTEAPTAGRVHPSPARRGASASGQDSQALGAIITVDGEEAVAALVVLVGDVQAAYRHVALLLAEHFADGFVVDALHCGKFLGGARLEEGSVVVVGQAQPLRFAHLSNSSTLVKLPHTSPSHHSRSQLSRPTPTINNNLNFLLF